MCHEYGWPLPLNQQCLMKYGEMTTRMVSQNDLDRPTVFKKLQIGVEPALIVLLMTT